MKPATDKFNFLKYNSSGSNDSNDSYSSTLVQTERSQQLLSWNLLKATYFMDPDF